MKVNIENSTTRSDVLQLANALEAESFSSGCTIGAIEPIGLPDEHSIYIKIHNAKYGVLIPANTTDLEIINWVIKCLKESVIIPN